MAIADLTTGAARLNKSVESLQEAWAETREHWNDENSRNFEENYLDPLGPQVKLALDAVNRIGEILNRAERECQDNGLDY